MAVPGSMMSLATRLGWGQRWTQGYKAPGDCEHQEEEEEEVEVEEQDVAVTSKIEKIIQSLSLSQTLL